MCELCDIHSFCTFFCVWLCSVFISLINYPWLWGTHTEREREFVILVLFLSFIKKKHYNIQLVPYTTSSSLNRKQEKEKGFVFRRAADVLKYSCFVMLYTTQNLNVEWCMWVFGKDLWNTRDLLLLYTQSVQAVLKIEIVRINGSE